MQIFKKTLLVLTTALCSLGASAQAQHACCQEAQQLGYRPYPYTFVQLQGGLGTTFTNKAFTDLLSPTASVGFGRFFGSAVGARLHVNAWESKGGFNSIEDTYKFKYVNTNADLLLNLTNLFSKRDNHLFNVILVGGVGLNYAWGNDDLDAILARPVTLLPTENTTNAWGEGKTRESLLSHNLRAGLLFDFNLAKHWNVGVEIDANSLDDRFNSKYNNSDDWMVTAQLSLTYKFGHKKPCQKREEPVIVPEPEPEPIVEPEPEPIVEPEPEPIVEPEPVVEPEPIVVVEEKPLKETIFYAIRESDPDQEAILNKVVAWHKEYPAKTITVQGYADKGTGTPQLNVGYAQKRAEKVAAALKAKGVAADNLAVSSYGDTVQPFAENDKNRCVIIEGK